MKDRTHVPDKLEGYLLQTRHALFDLISHDPNLIVSVEAYDDVATEHGNLVVAEQIKSVLSDNNPLANKSVVFWKTICNWSKYISSGLFDGKELKLKFVIVATPKLNTGTIPQAFHDTANIAQAKAALEAAKLEICGEPKTPKEVSDSLKPYIKYCFSKENESAVLDVIQRFTVELHSGDYDEKLRERFNAQPIPTEYTNELFLHMLGWVNEEIHKQIKKNVPAYLLVSTYLDELRAQTRKYDCNHILSAVSALPEDSEKVKEIQDRSTYIRQLELIGLDYTDLFEAACDFLRTRAEKIEWANRGLITQDSMYDYDDSLIRLWKAQKKIATIEYNGDAVRTGVMTYSTCISGVQSMRLQGCDVPSFFGSGCLYSLSNEPKFHPQIGWHPDYIQLLREAKEDSEAV